MIAPRARAGAPTRTRSAAGGVLALLAALLLAPLAGAEKIALGGDLLVLTVEESTRGGVKGHRLSLESAAAPVRHDVFAGCRADLVHSRCRVEDTPGSTAPALGTAADVLLTTTAACADLRHAAAPARATLCAPGRAFPVPWGQCASITLSLAPVLDGSSSRCLPP